MVKWEFEWCKNGDAISINNHCHCFTPVLLFYGKHLEMLELGEQTSTSLGVDTNKTRIILMISSVLIIALATATTGPIAFVAFLAGPIAKS